MLRHPTKMSSFIYFSANFNLSGKTLIVPVVSTANVSQLAADLLISTLSLDRVAIFDPQFCVPVAGARDDGLKGITVPLELYGKSGVDVVIVQQRSSVLKSRKEEFVSSLLEFIDSSNFETVLFLSGVDLSDRTDAQMFTTTFHIIPNKRHALRSPSLENITSLSIPVYTSPVLQRAEEGLEGSSAPIPFIPGGGLTRRILSALPETWSTPTASLLQFALEGDNRGDARLLAAVTLKVVGLDVSVNEWKQPKSWQVGLFGAPHDQSLYG